MLGEKIKELVGKSNLTQGKAAEKLEMSLVNLTTTFKKEHVSTKILYKLCEVFDVEICWFFKDENYLYDNNIVEEPAILYQRFVSLSKKQLIGEIERLNKENDLQGKLITYHELKLKELDGNK